MSEEVLILKIFYDLPIGQKFAFEGTLNEVVFEVCEGKPGSLCVNCDLKGFCELLACLSYERSDGNNVYFKEVKNPEIIDVFRECGG